MNQKRIQSWAVAAALVIAVTGCENLPGTKGQQGAVAGGVTGAAVGAAVAHNRVLGALIGGAIGAGGGYLIGANVNKITGRDREAAERANTQAQTNPVTAEQAARATTADVNGDGFVTLDEVIAMKRANVPDDEMLRRMRASGQVFELTPEQQQTLLNNGVSQYVISQMATVNRDRLPPGYSSTPPYTPTPDTTGGVISRPPVR